jgi:hypothetical protein
MKSLAKPVALALFTALGLFLIAFGILYASVSAMLPFHAAAVPADMREAVGPLYRALMTLIGGACIGLGGLGLWVTWVPLRKGQAGAALAVSAAYVTAILTAAFVAERLADETGAPTSWHIMGGLIAVNALALGLSLFSRRPS